MQVIGYVTIKTIFGNDGNVKIIKVRYMVINASSPYNITIVRSYFNTSGDYINFIPDHEIPVEQGASWSA